MDTDTVQVFAALLTVVTWIATVVVLVAWRLRSRTAWAHTIHASVQGSTALVLAWLVATGATVGSLYMSEVANFVPCTLCWYQRIAMYPLAVILLIAAVRRDVSVKWYALPIAIIGVVISVYHYFVEWFPQIETNVCSLTVPCSNVWFREFGFISLPLMAASAFVFVITVLTTTSTLSVPPVTGDHS
jgi:disulfide bond formation protein DsbB